MCLGVPGKIVSIDDMLGVVDFWGVQREVALHIVDEPVAVGDYVLVHVGFAIRRIPPEDIARTLEFFEELSAEDLEGVSPKREGTT
ncbi:MAG: HypC/HybG/HupF family hydrogenase formation chaperone [Deltaproteobacteria bacterium]|nr:HypC/HybG/HupF family hydrogenase formation chaperone [Deltaproteobacteria bacterium]